MLHSPITVEESSYQVRKRHVYTRTKMPHSYSREYAWIKYYIEVTFQLKSSITISSDPAHM